VTPAQLSRSVRGAVVDGGPHGRVVIESPPRRGDADYATAAPLQWAARLGRDAQGVARQVCECLAAEPGVARAEVVGRGYVHVTLDARGRAALVRALAATEHRVADDDPAADVARWAAVTGENPESLRRRTEDCTLFRVQFGHVRARSVVRNAHELGVQPEAGADGYAYAAPEERALLARLADTARVRGQGDDARLARHLDGVAAALAGCTDACPPLPAGGEKPGAAHRARTALAEAAAAVLAGGLTQLGVTAPARL
jgi:arginyl-tRNA synthetase